MLVIYKKPTFSISKATTGITPPPPTPPPSPWAANKICVATMNISGKQCMWHFLSKVNKSAWSRQNRLIAPKPPDHRASFSYSASFIDLVGKKYDALKRIFIFVTGQWQFRCNTAKHKYLVSLRKGVPMCLTGGGTGNELVVMSSMGTKG